MSLMKVCITSNTVLALNYPEIEKKIEEVTNLATFSGIY